MALGSSQLGALEVVLTDFERTLGRLFEDPGCEKRVFDDIWGIYAEHDVPTEVREVAGESPYSLWTAAYEWMMKRVPAADAEAVNQDVATRMTRHELEAAGSFRLLEGVPPVLERLQSWGIGVGVVSNNSTKAVQQALEANKVEGLIDKVFGREPDFRMRDLKPRPALLQEALGHYGCAPDRAIFVGDSVIDMAAGQAADIGLTVGVLDHSTASEDELSSAGARLVLKMFSDLEPLVLSSLQAS
jgi:HAD superfamily hydrolase (TIGR01549 family)